MTRLFDTVPDLLRLPIRDAGKLLRSGALTSVHLTRQALDRVRALDRYVRTFVLLTETRAMTEAAAADADFAAGIDRGPMQGIPYAVKDIFDVKGTPTTANSKLFANQAPASADSAVVERLAAAGGVLLGKLTTYECATVGPDQALPFPPARNPWNTDHVTGGSSSGSGAAVAAGFVRAAIGSDTAGSVRGPAGYCGVFGLKPSFGLVSRHGSLPMAPSFDHCGVLGKTPDDIAVTMAAIVGHDARDRGSVAVPRLGLGGTVRPWEGKLRVGVPRHFFAASADAGIVAAIDRTLGALQASGAEVGEVDLPPYEVFFACGRVVMLAEAFSIHEEAFRHRRDDFGPHMREWIGPGAFVAASDYLAAQRLRETLTDAVERSLQEHDVLLTASIMTPAPRFDSLPARGMAPIDMQCFPPNITGHPAVGVPTGLAADGLPLSLQLVGRRFDDARLLRIALTTGMLAAPEMI